MTVAIAKRQNKLIIKKGLTSPFIFARENGSLAQVSAASTYLAWTIEYINPRRITRY